MTNYETLCRLFKLHSEVRGHSHPALGFESALSRRLYDGSSNRTNPTREFDRAYAKEGVDTCFGCCAVRGNKFSKLYLKDPLSYQRLSFCYKQAERGLDPQRDLTTNELKDLSDIRLEGLRPFELLLVDETELHCTAGGKFAFDGFVHTLKVEGVASLSQHLVSATPVSMCHCCSIGWSLTPKANALVNLPTDRFYVHQHLQDPKAQFSQEQKSRMEEFIQICVHSQPHMSDMIPFFNRIPSR